jgi:hypothetical protein
VLEGQPQIARGSDTRLAFDDAHVHVFDANGERIEPDQGATGAI